MLEMPQAYQLGCKHKITANICIYPSAYDKLQLEAPVYQHLEYTLWNLRELHLFQPNFSTAKKQNQTINIGLSTGIHFKA
jgi:hypothetical protein